MVVCIEQRQKVLDIYISTALNLGYSLDCLLFQLCRIPSGRNVLSKQKTNCVEMCRNWAAEIEIEQHLVNINSCSSDHRIKTKRWIQMIIFHRHGIHCDFTCLFNESTILNKFRAKVEMDKVVAESRSVRVICRFHLKWMTIKCKATEFQRKSYFITSTQTLLLWEIPSY